MDSRPSNVRHDLSPPTPMVTATQFFSLPSWRKRSAPKTPVLLPAYDKDLPPTPPDSDEPSSSTTSSQIFLPRQQGTLQASSSLDSLPPTRTPTRPIRQTRSPDDEGSKIRKAKSVGKLYGGRSTTTGSKSQDDQQRRLSFSPPAFLDLSPIDHSEPRRPSTSQSLSRRASLWFRKSPSTNAVDSAPHSLFVDKSPSLDLGQLLSPPPVSRSRSETSTLLSPGLTPFPKAGRVSHEVASAPPLAAPRPRAHTNPPLLHRLSLAASSSDPLRSPIPPIPRTPTVAPKPTGDESPAAYVSRCKASVSKAEIAGVLASSVDPFYASALRSYISEFNFVDIPLDIALRKLLMEVGLPKETQQIDRVMEAFAARYTQCNPGLFASDDQPYILAFSLIMLHTDAFNRHNKHKMTKPDYIKNTRLPDLPPEVLDCFYDNIVFAPFIFVEDPVDALPPTPLPPSSSGNSMKMGNKVDPYYLITNNLLASLRINISECDLNRSPYKYQGTGTFWDEQELHRTFIDASVIEFDVPAGNRSFPFFGPSLNGGPVIPTEPSSPRSSDLIVRTLRLTKVGMLTRKDDALEGGKRSMNRKWKIWSVILTGSQLLFFRDPTWALSLTSTDDFNLPGHAEFRPDEIYTVKDAIALLDTSYTKYANTFRLVLHNGRQMLLQCGDEEDLHQWLLRINYASAFRTAGVKIRPSALSGETAHLTGVAAATSHMHDIHHRTPLSRSETWDAEVPGHLMGMLSPTTSLTARPTLKRKVTMPLPRNVVDLDPLDLNLHESEEFKKTFHCVKADLADTLTDDVDESVTPREGKLPAAAMSQPCLLPSRSAAVPTRADIIQSKIDEFDTKIAHLQAELSAETRYLRNIGILTPFKRATRSKLQTCVPPHARKISSLRLELERFTCYRTILHRDFLSEGETLQQSRKVALHAAKETLQKRYAIPTMTISNVDDPDALRDSVEFPETSCTSTPGGPGSSKSGSFHSATDSGFDWPSSEEQLARSTFEQARDSSRTSLSVTGPSSPASRDDSFGELPVMSADRQEATVDNEEEAEQWDKTRAAKRVSLIHLPSALNVTSRIRGLNGS